MKLVFKNVLETLDKISKIVDKLSTSLGKKKLTPQNNQKHPLDLVGTERTK